MKKKINIAIDGPSGVGKSTLAKSLAKDMAFIYIDTGALYRAVGLYAFENNIPPKEEETLKEHFDNIKIELRWTNGTQHIYLGGRDVSEDIRLPQMSMYASYVSALPAVRSFLLDMQHTFAENNDCIMDGRDIGTVILPNADVKIFLSADEKVRAKRRYEELLAKGKSVTFDDVYHEMLQRDKNDSERQNAPCVPAADAILVDNGNMNEVETLVFVKKLIEERLHESI